MKRITGMILRVAVLLAAASSVRAWGSKSSWNKKSDISVLSREDGSGTRGAFIELFGIEQKNAAGQKVDMTTDDAAVTNSTAVMMTSVAGDKYAVGYISLGSLNDTVKAVKIDGVAASVENIKAGSYRIARPFNIAVKDGLSAVAEDFVAFIMSAEGQAVVRKNGYIAVSPGGAFRTEMPAGRIVVAGSSSVSPVMEKLAEEYRRNNPNAQIEIQTSDSTTGMTGAADGICDIGMASRELKDSEKNRGLKGLTIAMDGIAVIVNRANPADDLTAAEVRDIFTGAVTSWNAVVR